MNRIKKVTSWIWDQIKMPVTLMTVAWLSGFGFYHGVIAASDIGKLSMGKAIVITVFDMSKDKDEDEE